jgi:TetR/AcrR family transcriptional regulator, transcriptional repressor for nem operon
MEQLHKISFDYLKRSFYYYFKSKEEFGKTILDYYNHFFTEKLKQRLLNENISSALERIHAFCTEAKTNIAKYNFNRGCLVGKLMQNESHLPPDYPILLNNILHHWQNQIANCL